MVIQPAHECYAGQIRSFSLVGVEIIRWFSSAEQMLVIAIFH